MEITVSMRAQVSDNSHAPWEPIFDRSVTAVKKFRPKFGELKIGPLDAIYDQRSFDELFELLFHHQRSVAIRSAHTIEKITRKNPEYLVPHTDQLLATLTSSNHKELFSHVTKLISRLPLREQKLAQVWHVLRYRTLNQNENKTVRANALQALFDLSRKFVFYKTQFETTVVALGNESIPSLKTRICKITKHLPSRK
jgi:hypothetical protein